MLITLSPAKALDTTPRAYDTTTPRFMDEAAHLAGIARGLDIAGLRDLMGLSEDLAKLNHARFRDFADHPKADATWPAAFLFAGDTYKGFEATTLDDDALRWSQDHVRILSGLYGVLRPLDAIQPYRLEMGARLRNEAGATLYAFWGDRIASALNAEAEALGSDVVINCASQEYFKAADRVSLKPRVITPVFYEPKESGPKIVSFYAKRARGAMARFAAERGLTDPEDLKAFDAGGYAYAPDLSDGDTWAFLRRD